MVKSFQFARIPRLLFSEGIISDLPGQAILFGRNLALVTGKSSFMSSLRAEKLLSDFGRNGIAYHHIVIQGEPSPSDIDSAVIALKGKAIDLVVGIGGGSVLDAGKALSAMVNRSESVKRFLEGVGDMVHPGTKVPYIALPTTSGTGSEVTKNAVISETGVNGFKKSLRHDNFVPDLAMIDPELTLDCPPDITASSGMDCFTQLIEAYLSDKSFEYTDVLALEGLKVLKKSLIKCWHDGHEPEARKGMSFAALTSGICLANAGLGVVHGLASSIGGLSVIPHGLVCGTLMAKSNEVTVRKLRKKTGNGVALRKYTKLGQLFINEEGRSDDYYIDGFIEYLHQMTQDLRLPGLKKFGFDEKDFHSICALTENKNNPVKLTNADLHEILKARYL